MEEDQKNIDFSNAKYNIEVSKGAKHFKCNFYSIDFDPPKNIGKLFQFYQIWRNAFQGDKIPTWKNFSFEDFTGWHSNMRVMKCGDLITDKQHCLIVGETFANFLGKKSLSELIHEGSPIEKSHIENFHRYLGYLHNLNYCISEGILPMKNICNRSILLLDFPLSDNGIDVTHYLTALQPMEI